MKLLAVSTHRCNEVGDYDTPSVEKQGTRPFEKAEDIITSL
jgi:hypothetical protein